MGIKISIALVIIGIIAITFGILFKILHYSIGPFTGTNILTIGIGISILGVLLNIYFSDKK